MHYLSTQGRHANTLIRYCRGAQIWTCAGINQWWWSYECLCLSVSHCCLLQLLLTVRDITYTCIIEASCKLKDGCNQSLLKYPRGERKIWKSCPTSCTARSTATTWRRWIFFEAQSPIAITLTPSHHTHLCWVLIDSMEVDQHQVWYKGEWECVEVIATLFQLHTVVQPLENSRGELPGGKTLNIITQCGNSYWQLKLLNSDTYRSSLVPRPSHPSVVACSTWP